MKGIKCKSCKILVNDWCDVKCGSPDPELVRDCIGFEQMTNGDRIRAMSDEEFAKSLAKHIGSCPPDDFSLCEVGCKACWLGWLKQPVRVKT